MRVLVANKFFWLKGGAERVVFDLIRAYEARGHEVVPFAMRDERNISSRWDRYFVSKIDYDRLGSPAARVAAALRTIHSFEAAERIDALCQEAQPDVAHLHNIHHQLSPSILGSLARRGVPAVFTLHDYKLICPNYLLFTEGAPCERCRGGRFHEAIVHRCVHGSRSASAVAAIEMGWHRARRTVERGVKLFISPSRFLAGRLVAHGFDPERVRVVPNGVDLAEFEEASGETAGFVFAGRLSPEKGLGTLLEAMRRVPSATLSIAGSGPAEEELRANAERCAPGRIRFLGALGRVELLALIRSARALCLPSIWYENAPISALEAMASGVPVIGSDIGGVPEIVRHESTGLLFPSRDAGALAMAIDRLNADPACAKRLGGAGRQLVREEYGLDLQADRMLDILEEVASSRLR